MASTGSRTGAAEWWFGREDGESGTKLLPGWEGPGRMLQPRASPGSWRPAAGWWMWQTLRGEKDWKAESREVPNTNQHSLYQSALKLDPNPLFSTPAFRIISDIAFPGHGDQLDSRTRENSCPWTISCPSTRKLLSRTMSLQLSDETLSFRARQLRFGLPELSLNNIIFWPKECKLLVEYVKIIQRRKLDWALRIDVLFLTKECSPKAMLERWQRALFGEGRGFVREQESPFWNIYSGTLMSSSCSARQCQNQNWRPDPLTPLSFPKTCNVKKGAELFWVLGYQKDPCSSSQHLPPCFLLPVPLFFLSWGFSLPSTSAQSSDHQRPTPGPFLVPGPLLFLSQESPTWSPHKIFTFF